MAASPGEASAMTREFWSIATALVLACACSAPSEEEIKKEFAEYVATRKACATDDDCVLAWTDCPLGCGTAVSLEHQSDVERKARELIEDYESGGQSCVYDCMALTAVCADGSCTEMPQ